MGKTNNDNTAHGGSHIPITKIIPTFPRAFTVLDWDRGGLKTSPEA